MEQPARRGGALLRNKYKRSSKPDPSRTHKGSQPWTSSTKRTSCGPTRRRDRRRRSGERFCSCPPRYCTSWWPYRRVAVDGGSELWHGRGVAGGGRAVAGHGAGGRRAARGRVVSRRLCCTGRTARQALCGVEASRVLPHRHTGVLPLAC